MSLMCPGKEAARIHGEDLCNGMQKTCSDAEFGNLCGLRKWELSGNRKELPAVQELSAEMCRNQRDTHTVLWAWDLFT